MSSLSSGGTSSGTFSALFWLSDGLVLSSARCREESHSERGRGCFNTLLEAAGHLFTEQDFGLANQFRFHIGEHAIEIECDTKRHFRFTTRQPLRYRT